jgi:hypothetical protein
MDGHSTDKSRVLVGGPKIIVSLCVLLAASLFFNVWQYGVIQGQCSSNMTPKAPTAQSETTGQQVELRRKQNRVEADKRFDQLYKELESLSRLNDQMVKPGLPLRDLSRTADGSVKPTAVQ